MALSTLLKYAAYFACTASTFSSSSPINHSHSINRTPSRPARHLLAPGRAHLAARTHLLAFNHALDRSHLIFCLMETNSSTRPQVLHHTLGHCHLANWKTSLPLGHSHSATRLLALIHSATHTDSATIVSLISISLGYLVALNTLLKYATYFTWATSTYLYMLLFKPHPDWIQINSSIPNV